MKSVFIVWERYQRRSALLAERFRATIYYVYHGRTGQLLRAPLRYMVQAWRTWRILRQERPDVIFVQNPPIFAVLVVSIYARCYGARYVIDSHTGAFIEAKWGWSVRLHRLLSSWALQTVVHNKSQEKIVNRWGCRYYVLEDPVGNYPTTERFSFDGQLNAAVVSSFRWDEPLDVIFEAAAGLSGVTFYVTGDYRRCASTLLSKMPDNCRLTGYIPYQQYIGLLRGVDVVIDLVSNGDTLLCGAFEAVSVGTPLIVSDWPVLQDCFPIGAVHVPNTVEGVRSGVRRALCEQVQLRRDILLLREQHQAKWEHKFTELVHLLQEGYREAEEWH